MPYTGTKHTASDWSTTGITLASDGAFHAPNFYINSDGEVGLRGTLIQAYTGVSDTVILAHDGVSTLQSEVYTKVKTITLGAHVKENQTLRIKFDLRTDNASGTAYGRVYRNGGAVGTGQSTVSESYVTKSEDITNWSATDTIELYIRISDNTYQVFAQNFRVCGEIADIVDEITGTNS